MHTLSDSRHSLGQRQRPGGGRGRPAPQLLADLDRRHRAQARGRRPGAARPHPGSGGLRRGAPRRAGAVEGPGRRGAGPARAGGRSRPRLHRRGAWRGPAGPPASCSALRGRRRGLESADGRSPPARRRLPRATRASSRLEAELRAGRPVVTTVEGSPGVGAVLPRPPGIEVLRRRSHLRERRLVGPPGLRGDALRADSGRAPRSSA